MNSTNNLALSFVLAGIVCLSVFFVTFSLATLIFAFFILLFGNIFSYIVANKKNNFTEVKIYNIVFSFYIFLAINYFLGYQADWASFTQDWRDEYKFFIMTESNQYLSITQNYKDSFIDRVYIEYGLYVFYISSLASIAHTYFDGNHLLLQFLGSTVFGVLSSVIIYKILKLYIDPKKAYIYTLIFMFFSVFNFYSYNLFRDIAIAFFYICGIYYALERSERKQLLKLVFMLICNWLVFELRFEHGILFSFLTLYVGFKIFAKNKIMLLIFGAVSIILFASIVLAKMDMLLGSLESYSTLTDEAVKENEGSISQYTYNLPSGLKQITIALISQIQPFPSWNILKSANNMYQGFYGFLQILYSFFWFIIFFSLLKWVFFEKKIYILRRELIVVAIIFILFLLANTANMTIRRLIGFYPFIFLIYVFIKEYYISRIGFQKTTLMAVFIYLFLILVYLLLKI